MRREREYSPPRYGSRRDDRSSSLDGPMRSYDREDRGKFLGRRERGREMSSDRSPSPRRRRDDGRRDDSLDDRPPGCYSPGDGYYHRRRYPMDHDSPYTRRDRDGRDENFRGARNSSPGEPGDDFRGRFRGDKYGSGSGEQNKHRRYSVVARGVDRSATQDDLRKFFGRCSDVKDVYIPLHYKTKQPRGFAFIEFETEWAMVKVLKQLQGVEFLGRRLMLEEAEGEPSTAEEMRRRFQQRRQWRQENGDFGDHHRGYRRGGGPPLYRQSRNERRFSRSPDRRGE
ncbi:RNA recognition motif-containing protein [Toxoplasma gondii ARI]|uniref:RNA recognition motif-containing protein n=1 Tax=Toxoplasma gondii ARI TaxID=1074872 RepID=A0A139XR93_TOXGO|nr:RNA recognition motif-containing protein [Toxoplasma gondii ARI]